MKKFVPILALLLIPRIAFAAHGDDYINDTFTEGSNTPLESHTPDTGTSWTEQFTVGGGSLGVVASTDRVAVDGGSLSDGAYYTAAGTYATADYSVCVDIVGSVESGDDPYWLFARWQDANNFYVVEFNSGNQQIYENTAGTFATLGSAATATINANDQVCFIVDGSSLSITIAGAVVTSATDATISSAGVAGLGAGNIGESPTSGYDLDSQAFDNFLVEEYNVTCTSATAAGAGSDVAGVGTLTWSNTSNITSSDNSDASATCSTCGSLTTETTHYLVADNFGFSISASEIVGVSVSVERACNIMGGSEGCSDNELYLVKAGTVQTGGDNKALSPFWPTSDTTQDYGGTIDLWGVTLSEADVENSGFGFALSADLVRRLSDPISSVDYIEMTVCYVEAAGGGTRRVFTTQ